MGLAFFSCPYARDSYSASGVAFCQFKGIYSFRPEDYRRRAADLTPPCLGAVSRLRGREHRDFEASPLMLAVALPANEHGEILLLLPHLARTSALFFSEIWGCRLFPE